jgi:hypothetical protein
MAAAFTATKSMIVSAQVGNALQSMDTLANGSNQYLMTSGTNSYSGISVSQLTTLKLVPSGMSGATVNPWGGSYAVSAINSNQDFQIVMTAVPTAVSTRLISALGNVATVTYDATTSTLTAKYDKG